MSVRNGIVLTDLLSGLCHMIMQTISPLTASITMETTNPATAAGLPQRSKPTIVVPVTKKTRRHRRWLTKYVQHCMRFYARHPRPKFHSDADKQNWYACENALRGFTDSERDILLFVYREGDTIPDNVYRASVDRNIKQDTIWKLINELERKIAKRRNLI